MNNCYKNSIYIRYFTNLKINIMNKKGTKTTIFAIFGAILFLACLVMLFTDNITSEEFNIATISIMSVVIFLIGLYAKDYNRSHSIDNSKD